MNIPDYYREKVIRYFGDRGKAWLEGLPDILEKCIDRWQLTAVTPLENLSVNLVCFAKSPSYGDVVLKLGVPHSELFREMRALSIYSGRYICKCHDTSEELCAMLLERILPGTTLREYGSPDEQARIAAELISKLPVPIWKDPQIPEYSEVLSRAFKRSKQENKVGSTMLKLIGHAEDLFKELDNSSRPRVLLHGDLHHWNILRDSDGFWKAIDPHGMIGIPVVECARFIQNHIEGLDSQARLETLNKIMALFSGTLREDKRTLAECFFVLQMLSACWDFEEAEPNEENLIKAVELCEFSYEYLSTI